MRMRSVLLEEDTVYPYLKPNAQKRIEVARHVARNTGMLEHSLVSLGGYTWCLFPWLGTRSFRTLRKFIARNASLCKISNLEFEGCYYMTFRMERGNDYDLLSKLAEIVETDGIDCEALVQSGETPLFEKYDEHIPADLLRRAFALHLHRAKHQRHARKAPPGHLRDIMHHSAGFAVDAFHGTELFACCYFVLHFWHVDVDNIAECVLGIVGDANITVFTFNANVLV